MIKDAETRSNSNCKQCRQMGTGVSGGLQTPIKVLGKPSALAGAADLQPISCQQVDRYLTLEYKVSNAEAYKLHAMSY